MTDRNRDGAEEREELLDELEENHQRARREAAGNPETIEQSERDSKKARDAKKTDRDAKKTDRDAKKTDRDEANPPRTTTGFVTAPKFGSAGSGGAELEPGPKKN